MADFRQHRVHDFSLPLPTLPPCEHGYVYRPGCHLCHPEKFPPHGTLAKYEQGCRCDECEADRG